MTGAIAVPIERDVAVVEGPDAGKYLQGQLSQDIDAIDVGGWAWSLLLQSGGKIDAWVRVHRPAVDRYELDVEPGAAAAVVARLQRFLIRTDAAVTTSGRSMTAVRGVPMGEPSADRAPILWPGVDGYDAVGPAPDGVAAGTPEDLEAVRVGSGAPAMGAELTADVIPAEVGTWFVDGSASFTKGCYVGQELVARVDSRGNNTPRNLSVLELARPVAVGSDVVADDGKVVGTLTSVSGEVGLAYLHRSVAEDAALTVTAPDGGSVAVRVRPG